MATGLNKVSIIGHLGKDPEVRYTQSGTAVSNMRVAVTERRKENNEWQDKTEWFTVICFGKTAENCGRFLAKGRQVYVEGRLQTRNWDDKDGNKRTSVEIVSSQLLFLGGKDNNQDMAASAPSQSQPAKSFGDMNNNSNLSSDDLLDDDIPF